MLKTISAIGLGAAVTLSPLAAFAQTSPAARHHYSAHKPTGSYRSEMRARHVSSKDRARAGAEYVRQMRMQ